MIENIAANGGGLLKLIGGQGLKIDKIGDLAKAKGLDGDFAQKLGSILKKFDKNNDSTLDLSEAKEALGSLKSKLGINGNGATVEQLQSFKDIATKEGVTNTPMLDGIIAGFKSFDADNNGKLSVKELKSAINTYKSVMQA
jgi:Ca2+-binding EF-hand superfamily protein